MYKQPFAKTLKSLVCLALGLFLHISVSAQTADISKLRQQMAQTNDSVTYLNLFNKLGFMLHMESADSCFYYGIKGNAMATRLHNEPGKADALANIGAALSLKGLYSQGLTYYSQALAIYKKYSNHGEVASMLMNSAITYSFIGDSIKSLQFTKKALNEMLKAPADTMASMLYANYADMNPVLPPDSVTYYLKMATDVANHFKDDRTLLVIDQLYADRLMQQGKHEQALPFIKHSLQIARSKNWEYHELEAYNAFADYYLAKKQVDSAIAEYNIIYKTAMANKFIYWQTEVLKSLLHCYELKNDAASQARINKLLVKSLEQTNINSNAFLGDYIAYNNAQQQVKSLEVVNKNNSVKIWLLIALSVLGIVFIALLSRMNGKVRRHSRMLSVLNEKIAGQNEELKLTDEFKGRLISMLAHDFRAPLASTISMIRLLREDEGDFEKEQLLGLYDQIETDIQNILLTFDNILQWIKKQLSGYVFNAQTLSVKELIDDAASMFKLSIDAKKIVFRNEVPDDLDYFSDKEIIQFINRNLIHNAIKFSPAGGVITVKAQVNANELIVSVKDEGRGISENMIKQLFSFNNNQKTDSLDKGAGIALTICKEFINKINGRLWAESKEKKGTTFYYALPLS
ncbi:tetratricopeptide repeat-containing sensor histidine kinase [Mucilaginibacter rubeus]|uniref:histidine kinase n=1 Tax=Mucilaginibacter rubeus TaxID=2027860 RepID=A0A5C1HSH2_9SPHI|nr:tetratricopeptide repeat-containing sensor histidine kinase [Mucilaginibacter rubeus]QEM08696.1 sensor histidine kinase [Mucilaginibacter rubeus]